MVAVARPYHGAAVTCSGGSACACQLTSIDSSIHSRFTPPGQRRAEALATPPGLGGRGGPYPVPRHLPRIGGRTWTTASVPGGPPKSDTIILGRLDCV